MANPGNKPSRHEKDEHSFGVSGHLANTLNIHSPFSSGLVLTNSWQKYLALYLLNGLICSLIVGLILVPEAAQSE